MPAVFVYDPWQLDSSVGGHTNRALSAARQLAANAGLGASISSPSGSDPDGRITDTMHCLTTIWAVLEQQARTSPLTARR